MQILQCVQVSHAVTFQIDNKCFVSFQCQSVSRGDVTGSMCLPLCFENKVVITSHCLNHPVGKKVYLATWNGRKIVLKIHEQFANQPFFHKNLATLPTTKEFAENLRNLTRLKYNVNFSGTDAELISQIWTGNASKRKMLQEQANMEAGDWSKLNATMRSLWSLALQPEFLFYRLFHKNKHIPKVYGSCGALHAVEFAPPTNFLDPDVQHAFRFTPESWPERVRIAEQVLSLTRSFDEDFSDRILACDLRGGNVGLTSDGTLKAIDTDTTIRLQSQLEQQVFPQVPCSSDKNCYINECLGRCDRERARCDQYIHNNNLQVSLKPFSLPNKFYSKG